MINYDTFFKQCMTLMEVILPWNKLKSIPWMNQKARSCEAYRPTQIEHVLNVITHGIWIVPSIFASYELWTRSSNNAQLLSAFVYGAALISVFIVSTTFHCVFYCNSHGAMKDVLHRCDRAMIYIFIAGSYFPWLTIQSLPMDSWATSMKWLVWLLAALGIIYQQVFHEKYKTLETLFYCFMGLFPAVPIITEHEFSGMTELKIGGLLYVIGILFFKSDGSIPCAHAIWHLFVVFAASVHYFAILNNLYPLLPQYESSLKVSQ